MGFYDYEAKDIHGKTVKMSEYKGYVVLVVNTATKCGLAHQFELLESIYNDYKANNFIVLGFPSNQFLHQEPGTNEQVETTCKTNFGVTFPLFEKIHVNGENAHPLFKYLKDEKHGMFGRKLKWNFTKFLIDREGNVVKRFAPTTKPDSIRIHVANLL